MVREARSTAPKAPRPRSELGTRPFNFFILTGFLIGGCACNLTPDSFSGWIVGSTRALSLPSLSPNIHLLRSLRVGKLVWRAKCVVWRRRRLVCEADCRRGGVFLNAECPDSTAGAI